jgi:hypothetical protein
MPIIPSHNGKIYSAKTATNGTQQKTAPAKFIVCQSDLENLRASGLSDETIRVSGLYTEYDPVQLATILNRLPERPPKEIKEFCQFGGLVIPYRNLQGEEIPFARVRPHFPRVRDGDPIKYEQPVGEPLHAYYPRSSLAALREGKTDIHLPEGEKKTLKLSQHGYTSVGIGGISCWKKKGSEELIDDLAAIQWKGRKVYLVFDHDKKHRTRQQVNLAALRLARALRKAGAKEVYIVKLPRGPKGDKQGVDDYMVAHGPEAYRQLVRKAKPAPVLPDFQPLTKAQGRTDVNNAIRLADKYRDDIRWVGPWDKFLLWDGTRWKRDVSLTIDLKAKDIAADIFTEIATVIRQEINA